jgi:glycosyltransferase involved in cell wall biosynthesis
MKVVMINDCASIAETLLNNLPPEIEKEHIKRTRRLFDKTFGISYRILRAKADIYHVHYLLQDCYLASRFGKRPLVGSGHGSDLRQQINSRKWGRIVRHNLKHCDKILVSQPTTLDNARRYNEEAEYFPIPYDPSTFYPKPMTEDSQNKTVLIASAHDFAIKGTDKFIKALAMASKPVTVRSFQFGKNLLEAQQLANKLDVKIEFIKRTPHNQMNELYWGSDLVLGSCGIGQLDTVAIEAMACGRPVVHSIAKDFFPTCPLEELDTVEKTSELISSLLWEKKKTDSRIRLQLDYVVPTHSAPVKVKRLLEIYSEIM